MLGSHTFRSGGGSVAGIWLTRMLCVLLLLIGFGRMAHAADLPIAIVGRVLEDTNGDGIQNDGDNPVPGAVVTLINSANVPVGSYTVEADGIYFFAPLDPDTYKVCVTPPTGWVSTNALGNTPETSGGVKIDNACLRVIATTPNTTYFFDDFLLAKPVKICGNVIHDYDRDGTRDTGEPLLNGVQIVLRGDFDGNGTPDEKGQATGTDGDYCFDNLPPGTYTVEVKVPVGYQATAPITRSVPATTPDTTYPDNDFFVACVRGNLGDVVYHDVNGNGMQDQGEPGIAGAVVSITDLNGNPVVCAKGMPAIPRVTDATGHYLFPELCAGSYIVTVDVNSLPGGLRTPTADFDSINTPHTAQVTLTAGQMQLDVDFGYTGKAILGDFVWNDLNGDGKQDTNEPGLANVKVTLIGAGQDGLFDTADDANYGEQTTNQNGYYQFTHLPEGKFRACVNAQTLPAGFVETYDLDGIQTLNCAVALIAAGVVSVQDVDFGYQQRNARLSGVTYCDENRDGIYNENEPILTGVKVVLKDAQGKVIADTVSDDEGRYSFTLLPAGSYTVEADTAAGDKQLRTTNPLTATLSAGEEQTGLNFGYAAPLGSLSGLAYCDDNNDKSYNPGEPLLSGVKITLKDVDGKTFEATTNSSGRYEFKDVKPGTFTVTAPNTFNGKVLNTTSPLTGTLKPGENKSGLDFGYVVQKGSLSGLAYCDTNNDKCYNSGEPLLSGVKITLKDVDGKTFEATTNSSGRYEFKDVKPGAFTLTAPATAGDKALSTTNPLTGTLKPGENKTGLDFGYRPIPTKGSICGVLYHDTNKNCVFNSGEPVLPCAPVALLNAKGHLVGLTLTDGHGRYCFSDLPADCYIVIVLPRLCEKVLFTPNCLTVNLNAGEKKDGINFGYVKDERPFCTFTQGGWGATPNGNNPGKLLHDNWGWIADCGLTVGKGNVLKFYTAQQVTDFLPTGGTPGRLCRSYCPPKDKTEAGVFAGQVTALKLNVAFSDAGICRIGLGDLKLTSGRLCGWTVDRVLDLAETVLGGNTGRLPSGLSISGLNDIVTRINENFDNGANKGYLK